MIPMTLASFLNPVVIATLGESAAAAARQNDTEIDAPATIAVNSFDMKNISSRPPAFFRA